MKPSLYDADAKLDGRPTTHDRDMWVFTLLGRSQNRSHTPGRKHREWISFGGLFVTEVPGGIMIEDMVYEPGNPDGDEYQTRLLYTDDPDHEA
jgi:hypothetical protein